MRFSINIRGQGKTGLLKGSSAEISVVFRNLFSLLPSMMNLEWEVVYLWYPGNDLEWRWEYNLTKEVFGQCSMASTNISTPVFLDLGVMRNIADCRGRRGLNIRSLKRRFSAVSAVAWRRIFVIVQPLVRVAHAHANPPLWKRLLVAYLPIVHIPLNHKDNATPANENSLTLYW